MNEILNEGNETAVMENNAMMDETGVKASEVNVSEETVPNVNVPKQTEDLGAEYDAFLGDRADSSIVTLDLQEAGSIAYYKEIMDKKEKLNIMFSVIDKYDNLLAYAGEITIKLLNREIKGYQSRIYNRALCLSKNYLVEISDVDEEEKIVYVSHAALKDSPRKQAVEKIVSLIGQNKNVRVKAEITDVFDSMEGDKMRQIVYVDICGLGILGRIPIKEWANAYTPNLHREAVVGSVVDVIITGMSETVRIDKENIKITKENRELYKDVPRRIVFRCSRRAYHKLVGYDPWDLALRKLREGMTIRFTVVESNKINKSFFAEIDGIPNFNAIGSFPDGVDYVPVGAEYSGFVSKIKPDKKYLRVRCLERIERAGTKNWREIDNGAV